LLEELDAFDHLLVEECLIANLRTLLLIVEWVDDLRLNMLWGISYRRQVREMVEPYCFHVHLEIVPVLSI